MDKYKKKTLKSIETKNGKNQNNTGKGQKERSKKSFWSKFKTVISKKITTTLGKTNSPKDTFMVNSPSKGIERWNPDKEVRHSQMINIPIGPGRQVSTVVLSPTKTGFKAVIAHYDDNARISDNLSQDILKRRTLTLVFNMENGKSGEDEVGASESEEEREETGLKQTKISASEIYVRSDTNELTDSTAFLQGQLSIDNVRTKDSPILAAEGPIRDMEKEETSCMSIRRARVAFKTLSEPIWSDKQAMYDQVVVKKKVHQMLNHIIYLERDPSFMGYLREFEEVDRERVRKIRDKEDKITKTVKAGTTSTVRRITREQCCKYPHIDTYSKMLHTNSLTSRTVAPDLLVNIKPFKEYVRKTEEVEKKIPAPRPSSICTDKSGLEFRMITKSRPSLCLKCGLEDRSADNFRPYRDLRGNRPRPKSVALKDDCSLCSIRRTYKMSSLKSFDLIRDSLDDILQELGSKDHESIFRKNIALFKSCSINQSDMGKSRSSLSFAELVEMEGEKLSLEKMTAEDLDEEFRSEQNYARRLIDAFRKTDERFVEFSKLKGMTEKLCFGSLIFSPKNTFRILEHARIFIQIALAQTTKVMGQTIQENPIRVSQFAERIPITRGCVTLIPDAFLYSCGLADGMASRRHSEKSLNEFTPYNKKKPIPDVINHLLSTKVDDLRNELLTRLNETRMCYKRSINGNSYVTEKIDSKSSTSTIFREDNSQSFIPTVKYIDLNFEDGFSIFDKYMKDDASENDQDRFTVLENEDTLPPAGDRNIMASYGSKVMDDSDAATKFKPLSSVLVVTPLLSENSTSNVRCDFVPDISSQKPGEDCLDEDYIKVIRSCNMFNKRSHMTRAGFTLSNDQMEETAINNANTVKVSEKEITTFDCGKSVNTIPNIGEGNVTGGDTEKREKDNAIEQERNNATMGKPFESFFPANSMQEDFEVRCLYYNGKEDQQPFATSTYSTNFRKGQMEGIPGKAHSALEIPETDLCMAPPATQNLLDKHDYCNQAAGLNGAERLPKSGTDEPLKRDLTANAEEQKPDVKSPKRSSTDNRRAEWLANHQIEFTLNEKLLPLKPLSQKDWITNVAIVNKIGKPVSSQKDVNEKNADPIATKEVQPKRNIKRMSVTVMLTKKWGDEKAKTSIPTRLPSK
ncbi:UNVERIFIED_CONTAM: hypothetical protein PYX00_004739 [Menopon gallinae]|uniref:Breast cancer type 2 susceptibility protein n=1 Tax=Menopon gallinae TaxID=328185 RepID=A0AAW2I737_9NEOP